MKIETECSQSVTLVSTEPGLALVYQSGILHFRFHKSGKAWRVVAEGVVVGRWHHVTVTWSATAERLSLYVDATLADVTGRSDALCCVGNTVYLTYVLHGVEGRYIALGSVCLVVHVFLHNKSNRMQAMVTKFGRHHDYESL